MGANTSNIEFVTDYSNQEGCVRLHIDVSLAASQLESFRRLMDAGKHSEAFALVRQSTRADNHGVVDAFELAFAEIVKSRSKAA